MFNVWHRDKLTKHQAHGFVMSPNGSLLIVFYDTQGFYTDYAEKYRLAP